MDNLRLTEQVENLKK